VVFSFAHNVYAARVSDEVLQIDSDNLIGTHEGGSVKFYGNTIIRFKDHIIYTDQVIIDFIYVNKVKKIQKAVIPNAIILVNKYYCNDTVVSVGVYARREPFSTTKARLKGRATKLANFKSNDYIMIADQAQYSRDTKTLEIKGNVKLQKDNNLIIVDELILHTGII
jgi:lipopolysaccharide export system protein LptA